MKESYLWSCSKFLGIILLSLCLGDVQAVAGPVEENLMKKALPVWVAGREKEMNLTIGFQGLFHAGPGQSCKLKITASTLYRVFINGAFLGYGPTRAAHGLKARILNSMFLLRATT